MKIWFFVKAFRKTIYKAVLHAIYFQEDQRAKKGIAFT